MNVDGIGASRSSPLLAARRVYRKLVQRVQRRGDAEHEQAIIRVALGSVAVLYMLRADFSAAHPMAGLVVQWVAALFLSAALLLLISALYSDRPSPFRRSAGILVDLSATSTAMAFTGEAGAPLLAIYLWVIVGNGFRYGGRYLALATAISLLGMSAVIHYSVFWGEHLPFGASYMLVLVLIPAYVAALLEKLRVAIRRANEANRAKSQFLAKMSHELRTPLNGIIGMSDLLQDAELGNREREFVRTIHNSGETLLGIIDDILDFSKIEAGHLRVKKTEFDLHRLVVETLSMFGPHAQRKGIGLSHHFDPRMPFALIGDQLHIRQILMNLLANAIKFTDTGTVEVWVKPALEQDDENLVIARFEVKDTGSGIAAEEHSRIFDSFHQGTANAARGLGGTGLGTAIARELTHRMGGQIGLRSEPGQGSLFWFQLPLEVAHVPADEADQGLTGKRVLVAGIGNAAAAVADSLLAMGMRPTVTTCAAGAAEAVARGSERGDGVGLLLVIEHDFDNQALSALGTIGESETGISRFVLRTDAAPDRDQIPRPGFNAVLRLPLQRGQFLNALHASRSLRPLPNNVVSLAEYYRTIAPAECDRLHILVAEDNATNRSVLRAVLEQAGHRLTVVEDGEAALDALQHGDAGFDLMVLDKNMPRRDGLDVFRAQRFLQPGVPIPTIMLSADATDQALRQCREAGVDAYLTKPLQSRRLLETVARLAATRPKSRAVSQGSSTLPGDDRGANAALIDVAKLQSLRQLGAELDDDFFNELVVGFRQDAGRALTAIAGALNSEDYPALRGAVHALEGSARELGAIGLAAVLDRLKGLKPFELGSPQAQEILKQLRVILTTTSQLLTEPVAAIRDEPAPRPLRPLWSRPAPGARPDAPSS